MDAAKLVVPFSSIRSTDVPRVGGKSASLGEMFTIDAETGYPDVVAIEGAWGTGDGVVGGTVDPDEYLIHKPLLERSGARPVLDWRIGAKATKVVHDEKGEPTTVQTDDRSRRRAVLSVTALRLTRWGVAIDERYGRPMDMEWAKDGDDGELYVVQARPETVQSRADALQLRSYRLLEEAEPLVIGLAIGEGIAVGKTVVADSIEHARDFPEGGVLVTEMTDPDWVPVMRRASAVVTDHGGRTSRAAIVSRELGVPAVVGAQAATSVLSDAHEVTMSCAQGDEGSVCDARLEFEARDIDLTDLPEVRTRIMINVGSPAAALVAPSGGRDRSGKDRANRG